MNPIFKYFIDGIRFDDPSGWEKIDEVTRRDEALHGTFVTAEVTVELSGAAYRYLWKKRKESGIQSTCDLVVWENKSTVDDYEVIYRGIINITDIEFDRSRMVAKVKPQDNGYYSMINSNKSIVVDITATQSKNGLDILPSKSYEFWSFEPCNGRFDFLGIPYRNYRLWRVEDALKHLIAHISEGKIDVSCPPFELSGKWDGLCISNGWNLSEVYFGTNKMINPSFSFQDLIKELNRKDRFWFYVDYSKARPVFVFDFEDAIFLNENAREFNNRDLTVTFDLNRLYSKVNLGSGAFKERTDDDDCHSANYFEQMPWYGCSDEEYTLAVTGNIDKALDLKGQWSVSHNIIAGLTHNNLEENLDDIFFIHCEYDPAQLYMKAIRTEIYPDTFIYNKELMNFSVASRFISGFPGTLNRPAYKPFGQTKAFKTQNTPFANLVMLTASVFNPIQFDDDYSSGEDFGNNYGNGTTQGLPVSEANSRFTAPFDGVFNLELFIGVEVQQGIYYNTPTSFWQDIDLEAGFYVYDSLGTQVAVYDTLENLKHAYVKIWTVQKQVYLQAGQYVQCGLRATSKNASLPSLHPFRINGGSHFSVNSQFAITGSLLKYSTEDYKVALTKFSNTLSKEEYSRLKKNQFKTIRATGPVNDASEGIISDMKYSRLTGELTMTLLSSNKQLS